MEKREEELYVSRGASPSLEKLHESGEIDLGSIRRGNNVVGRPYDEQDRARIIKDWEASGMRPTRRKMD